MPTSPSPTHRALLVIDSIPLIRAALDACQEACLRVEGLKSDLARFEGVDVPAYVRWYNSAFGRYLTEVREARQDLRGKEALLADEKKRHWSRFFGPGGAAAQGEEHMGSGAGAFAGTTAAWDEEVSHGFKVFEGAENSADEIDDEFGPSREEFVDDEGDGSLHDDEEGSHYGEDAEDVRRFEDLFVRGEKGSHGYTYYRSRGSKGADEERERRRQSQAGSRPGSGSAPGGSAPGNGSDDGSAAEADPARAAESLRTRIKDRYRMLVRKLHPDLNPGLTLEQKSLWNQVQAAYRDSNLDQLDVLHVLSDAFVGKPSDATSLDQLRRAAAEIDRLTAPLRRKLEEARQHRAWKFTELGDRAAIQRRIEREFQRDLMEIRRKLNQVETQLIRFTRRPRSVEAEERL